MMDTGAKRLELECQILCNALRQSWTASDLVGVVTAARQLAEFFPDLLAANRPENTLPNLYEMLAVDIRTSPNRMKSLFRMRRKHHLRTQKLHGRENRLAFYELLDMGLIMRNARLRLSHDLNVLRQTLSSHGLIPDDGGFSLPGVAPTMVGAGAYLEGWQLPLLVRIMVNDGLLGAAEVQAIYSQICAFKTMSVEEAILQAGYVTEDQLRILKQKEMSLSGA